VAAAETEENEVQLAAHVTNEDINLSATMDN